MRIRFYPSLISDNYRYNPLSAAWLFVLLVAVLTSGPSQAQGGLEFTPAVGMFLVAAPKMRDPRFQQTVILLVEHSEEGSLGFIINKKTEMTVADALPDLNLDSLAHSLYFGGPVQPSRIMYVYSDPDRSNQQKVIRGVYWGADYEDLKEILRKKDENALRIFFGYSGWGPGQLEFELSLDDWQLLPASTDHIFSPDTENLWRLLNRRKPGIVTEIFPTILMQPYM